MDGRKHNGGAREGAGRKPKADELKLIEKLSPYQDIALNALFELIQMKDMQAIRLYMEYLHGKPRQVIESENTHIFEDFDISKAVIFKGDSSK